jgi:hypothetical protein
LLKKWYPVLTFAQQPPKMSEKLLMIGAIAAIVRQLR